MGYQFSVQIDNGAHRLLRRLKANPAGVFPRPYKGYLLFLAGSADQPVLDWLARNMIALDSLTGEDIAFGVFARSYRFKLKTNQGSSRHVPQHVGEVEASEIVDGRWAVERLVKSGRCGWISNGDELSAVTYASDEIARGFDVLDSLPCAIAMDCLPGESHRVIELSEEVREAFIPLLRSALAEFSSAPGFRDLEGAIQPILLTHTKLEQLDQEKVSVLETLRTLRERADRLQGRSDPSIDLLELTRWFNSAREALFRGSVADFRHALTGSRRRVPARRGVPARGLEFHSDALIAVIEDANEKFKILHELRKTIESLEFYRDSLTWPLTTEWSARFLTIIENYVAKLVGHEVTSIPNSRQACGRMIQELVQAQRLTIDGITSKLPSPEEIWETRSRSLERRNQLLLEGVRSAIDREEEGLHRLELTLPQRRKVLESELERLARKYSAAKLPSFSVHLQGALNELKLNSYGREARSAASVFTGTPFKPDMLLKVWQAIAG